MRILFDQGTPVPLRRPLAGHTVSTAHEMGWAALDNGALLEAAEAAFDRSSPRTATCAISRI